MGNEKISLDDKKPLNNDPRMKIIISQDHGSSVKHKAKNVDQDVIRHFRIDGDVIKGDQTKKCDFLLLDDTKHTAYLIELKGADLLRAKQQLEETEKQIDLRQFAQRYYRIIYKSGTHSVQNSKLIEWKRKMGQRNHKPVVLIRRDEIDEDI